MNERSRLIQALTRLLDKFPEERIGQLIVNVATMSRPPRPIRTTEATDRELLESAIRREGSPNAEEGFIDPSSRRKDIVLLAGECWPEGSPFGSWISAVAKRANTTLIHISDDDLHNALLSGEDFLDEVSHQTS